MEKEEYNRLASEIVSACIEVHRIMGARASRIGLRGMPEERAGASWNLC